jgi:uncharacterized membrane protein YedE/YeeE
MKNVVAFSVGILFAIGLGMSGMTRPDIVHGFLDVTGEWDWRLMGVMIGAIGVHMIAFRLITKRASPILDFKFQLPSKKNLDYRLIVGAMIFGIGWGWAGICPGPAIVSLASGNSVFILFIVSMLIGMKTFQVFDSKLKK